jgi:hypothetical protein
MDSWEIALAVVQTIIFWAVLCAVVIIVPF